MFPQGGDSWGIGAIFVANDEELDLTDKAGNIIGKIIRENEWHAYVFQNNEKLKIGIGDQVWAGKGITRFLVVYGVKNDTYQILKNTFEKEVYLNMSNNKSVFVQYKDIFTTDEAFPDELNQMISGASIGINEPKFCMNLRSEPNVSSRVIKCISAFKREGYTHFEILEVKDDWAKVKSKYYKRFKALDYNDCPYNLEEEKIGWINTVDHKGFPNLWYAVSSY